MNAEMNLIAKTINDKSVLQYWQTKGWSIDTPQVGGHGMGHDQEPTKQRRWACQMAMVFCTQIKLETLEFLKHPQNVYNV